MLGLLFAALVGIDPEGVTVSVRWLTPPLPGREVELAFDFKVKPGHWFYGERKGAVSKPTKLTVVAPSGVVVGKAKFPPP